LLTSIPAAFLKGIPGYGNIAVGLGDLFELAYSKSSTNTIYQNQDCIKTLWSKVDQQQESINKQIIFNKKDVMQLEMMITKLNDSHSKFESVLETLRAGNLTSHIVNQHRNSERC